jgi:hypothetical protein
MRYSDDDYSMAASDIRIVKGRILADGSVISGQIKASVDSSAISLDEVAGVKVYCAYNPDIFAITDENGNFSISIDLAKYRNWKLKNKIPEFEEDGASSSSDKKIALIAEKTITKADGSEVTLSTIIPIDFGDEKTIDLNEVFDPTQNTSTWIKVDSKLNGTCKSGL